MNLIGSAPHSSSGLKVLDVLIIGGGLSGMMVAHEIHQTLPALSWRLIEARSVLGGRLANDNKGHRIDLGAAWVWPQQQPHMKKLLKTLSIPTFVQPDDDSSTRIDGGAVALIHAMHKDLPKQNFILDKPVSNLTLIPSSEQQCIEKNDDKLIQVETLDGDKFLAKRVVLAVAPKLASKHLTFNPPLSDEKQQAMSDSHTWMAGVTKISLVYPHRFWGKDMSNMGLPSQLGGPAFQVYDASTKDETLHALTFFALIPPGVPNNNDKLLGDKVAEQISTAWRYFFRGGEDLSGKVKNYSEIHVQRWPLERYISEDQSPVKIHPHPYPVRALSTAEYQGHLLFAGTETDTRSPGVMEGAVGAALRVVNDLKAYFQ